MRKLRKRSGPFFLISFISVLSIASYVIIKHKLRAESTNCPASVKKPPFDTYDSELHASQPSSGTVFVKPESDCVAPLTVDVKDSCNYYIFLKFIKSPENAAPSDSANPGNKGFSNIGFFASANSSVFLKVPPGVYNLFFASGMNWRGLADKFGPETKYFKASQTLTFYKDGDRLYGNTIHLYPQIENNSAYREIGLNEFPG